MIRTMMEVGKVVISAGSGTATTLVTQQQLIKYIPEGATTVAKVTSRLANFGISTAAGAIVTEKVYDGLDQMEESILTTGSKIKKNLKEAKEKRNIRKEEKKQKKEEE